MLLLNSHYRQSGLKVPVCGRFKVFQSLTFCKSIENLYFNGSEFFLVGAFSFFRQATEYMRSGHFFYGTTKLLDRQVKRI